MYVFYILELRGGGYMYILNYMGTRFRIRSKESRIKKSREKFEEGEGGRLGIVREAGVGRLREGRERGLGRQTEGVREGGRCGEREESGRQKERG